MKRSIVDLLRRVRNDVFGQHQPSITVDQEYSKSIDGDHPVEISEKSLTSAPPDVAQAKPNLLQKQAVSTLPETRYFEIQDNGKSRNIAYTISGAMNAENILLCLPGLLETKNTFLVIHQYFLTIPNCKVISIDFSGRGESDHLDSADMYKMSLYLADISHLIHGIVLTNDQARLRLTILGTSMGGVLAMYLTQIFGKKIYEIILNDIALTVNWTSLYALYKSMKNDSGFREVRQLAKDLRVDERVISDVQLPGHFDLSYRADIWGMNFHEALEDYKGKVGLIYGGKSKICTQQRVEEAKSIIPRLSTFEISDSGHPVPFTPLVCNFIQSEMGL
jgi:pimeloyl-ACP methyl ester carboxylesterase